MRKKILIVEDNENNRLLLRDLMEYHQYEVVEAENGEEGLKMAAESRPDLILMDMQMPVMDGFAAIRRLKAEPATRNIKIIGVTSFAMKGDRERVLAAGADNYVSKPIDTRELLKLVAAMLAGQGT